jgi:hypothetical protein
MQSFSYNSKIKFFRIHVGMDIFSCFGIWNLYLKFVHIFQLHSVYYILPYSDLRLDLFLLLLSLLSTDANKMEHFQQKFPALSFTCFFPHVIHLRFAVLKIEQLL